MNSLPRRFYCPAQNIHGAEICLTDKQAHHIKNVLRFKQGDKILVFDGKGRQYNCVIANVKPNEVVAKIISSEFCLSKETSKTFDWWIHDCAWNNHSRVLHLNIL